jgi:hypothetical protein
MIKEDVQSMHERFRNGQKLPSSNERDRSAHARELLSVHFDRERRGLVWRAHPSNPALRDMYAHFLQHTSAIFPGSQTCSFGDVYRMKTFGDDATLISYLHAVTKDLTHLARVPTPVASTELGLIAGAAALLRPLGLDVYGSELGYEMAAFFVEAVGVRWNGDPLASLPNLFRLYSASERLRAEYVTRHHLFIVDERASELVWLAGSVVAESRAATTRRRRTLVEAHLAARKRRSRLHHAHCATDTHANVDILDNATSSLE